jgi:hypothetical protein
VKFSRNRVQRTCIKDSYAGQSLHTDKLSSVTSTCYGDDYRCVAKCRERLYYSNSYVVDVVVLGLHYSLVGDLLVSPTLDLKGLALIRTVASLVTAWLPDLTCGTNGQLHRRTLFLSVTAHLVKGAS